ncbi:hypothetical protein Taro_014856, partial [Colocasia esculenta]|nr:hypothetical protein [Colocasia esculenta]
LDSAERSLWVPHARIDIYYPKGHEWVMEDVPDGAATFQQTYWLRNQEGLKKAAGCSPSHLASPAMDAFDFTFACM